MKDEYNEYYKISDVDVFKQIQAIRQKRSEWLKVWQLHAEWLGFDKSAVYKDHSCFGLFSSRFEGFAISFDKIDMVDNKVYKLVSVDKQNQFNIYSYRKGNKKEYAKFKEFYDSIGLTFNLNDLGDLLFPNFEGNNYPIGTINWNESDCFLVRVVWFGVKKSETPIHPSMIRIKESEYLALQGK